MKCLNPCSSFKADEVIPGENIYRYFVLFSKDTGFIAFSLFWALRDGTPVYFIKWNMIRTNFCIMYVCRYQSMQSVNVPTSILQLQMLIFRPETLC